VAIEGQRIGRYVLYDRIASGGMASVHFGRVVGPGGFARTVVIKRLHSHLVEDVEFASMFLDEGHLAARIHHPNVVPTIDVASLEGELLLVMEYVRGESLSRLLSSLRNHGEPIPPEVLSSIVLGVLYGLEAAHEAKSEQGHPSESSIETCRPRTSSSVQTASHASSISVLRRLLRVRTQHAMARSRASSPTCRRSSFGGRESTDERISMR
jgi:serine/threonine protein kinase